MAWLSKLTGLVIPPWARLILKALPYIVCALFAGALFLTRTTLHEVRQHDILLQVQSKLVASQKETQWITKLAAAQSGYTQSLEALSKSKAKSDEDTRQFAATPAGTIHCLDAGRVQSILAARADAEASIAAARGSRSLPAGSDTAVRP